MNNVIVSPPLPVVSTATELMGGQALSLVVEAGTLTLAPYSAANNKFAGFYYGQVGQKVDVGSVAVGEQVSYGKGFFTVPVGGVAIAAGDSIVPDPATGYFITGTTDPVGVALSGADANGFVKAEIF